MRLRRPLALAALLAAVSSAAWGQGWGRLPEGWWVPPKFVPAEMPDRGFTICKVMFTSVTREANGMGWSTDWPYAGINLMTRVGELTTTRVSKGQDGEPNHWVVRLTDDGLFQCPMLTASDVGTMALSPPERQRLREYLLKGGFFWADDFWGTRAWNRFSSEMREVLPEHSIVEVPLDHPLLSTMFTLKEIPQVSSINFWMRSGGRTDERGSDSPQASLRAIADEEGRIMVLMSYDTDISDSWEREGENDEYFTKFSPPGYALGVDVVLYTLTH
jgi:hypothetical protein